MHVISKISVSVFRTVLVRFQKVLDSARPVFFVSISGVRCGELDYYVTSQNLVKMHMISNLFVSVFRTVLVRFQIILDLFRTVFFRLFVIFVVTTSFSKKNEKQFQKHSKNLQSNYQKIRLLL